MLLEPGAGSATGESYVPKEVDLTLQNSDTSVLCRPYYCWRALARRECQSVIAGRADCVDACCLIGAPDRWFYQEGRGYRSLPEMVSIYHDSVGHGGNMLLNIAPPPNSTMPQEAMDIYAALGSFIRSCYGEGSLPSTSALASTTTFGAPHCHFLPHHSFSHTNLKSPCAEQVRATLRVLRSRSAAGRRPSTASSSRKNCGRGRTSSRSSFSQTARASSTVRRSGALSSCCCPPTSPRARYEYQIVTSQMCILI